MSSQTLPFTAEPHHLGIASIRSYAYAILLEKRNQAKKDRFSKTEKESLISSLQAYESKKIHNNVNFSRIQIPTILDQYSSNIPIEFETLGPYLADYIDSQGHMTLDKLTSEDATGLKLAWLFRTLFPKGLLVSLYDDYTINKPSATIDEKRPFSQFPLKMRENFLDSLTELFRDQGVILPHHTEPEDFLLLSETAKQSDAEELVEKLSSLGYIERRGRAILFVNHDAENPLYRKFHLRTKENRWLCEALDAATFLSKNNLSVVHIIVLPNYMQSQQDKVWEILRVLGVQPARYHNIFFNPADPSEKVFDTISQAFALYA